MKLRARITGMGTFLPEARLTNRELEKLVDTSDEWIQSRTGIKERRIGSSQETAATMGLQAALKAIESSGLDKNQIDLVICATMTPDYITPSSAALIQSGLDIRAAAYDCQAACTGFIYGLSQARAFIESGLYKNVLVVASEKMSAFIDFTDRNTCVLFGDGAGAAIISAEGPGLAIDQVMLGAEGKFGQLIMIPSGGSKDPSTMDSIERKGHFIKMEGREVFKHAVRQMGKAVENCLSHASLKVEDVSWLVPHQANQRIIDAITDDLKIDGDKVFLTLHKYGNTSGSSVAIALSELLDEKTIQNDEHILLVAFGAGLTWGASLLTKIK